MACCIRLIALILCTATAGAFAASGDLRIAAIQQLNSTAAPHIERRESTDPHFDAFDARMVEALQQQERAERALKLAINGSIGAADYLMRHAQDWRGRIESGNTLDAMVATAMNSPRLDVRMAGFEVQLAEDGVTKTPQEVEHLIQRLHEDPRGVGAWELWHLGVIGARGVDRERILAVLTATGRSEDDELRHWAVEGLNLFGGVEAIGPLLSVAANERASSIREIAFCGLALSGTFQRADRYEAIPGLLRIVENPRSDRQNVAWSYQALRQITGIRDLPPQPNLLREQLQSMGFLIGN
jgi:hypothetical protein